DAHLLLCGRPRRWPPDAAVGGCREPRESRRGRGAFRVGDGRLRDRTREELEPDPSPPLPRGRTARLSPLHRAREAAAGLGAEARAAPGHRGHGPGSRRKIGGRGADGWRRRAPRHGPLAGAVARPGADRSGPLWTGASLTRRPGPICPEGARLVWRLLWPAAP